LPASRQVAQQAPGIEVPTSAVVFPDGEVAAGPDGGQWSAAKILGSERLALIVRALEKLLVKRSVIRAAV